MESTHHVMVCTVGISECCEVGCDIEVVCRVVMVTVDEGLHHVQWT